MMLHTGFLLEVTIPPIIQVCYFLFLLGESLGVKDSRFLALKIHRLFFLECLSPFLLHH